MGLCYSSVMKTTVEIADALLAEAKKLARERDITLRELIESGLRKELAELAEEKRPYVWEDLSVGGGGLRPPFTWDDWAAIKEASRERCSDE